MKKVILMTILVSVITSLSCMALPNDTVDTPGGHFIYKFHYDSAGNTATVVGERWIDQKYGNYYPDRVDLDSIIKYRKTGFDPYYEFLLIAVENLKISGDDTFPAKRGLSGFFETRTIKLPASVKTIGELSMCNLRNLLSVKMPGVRTIGKEALSNNLSINEPIELRKLEYAGERAFKGCEKLWEIRFGPNLRFIGKDAFDGCEGLKTVDIGNPDTWSRVEFENVLANPISMAKNFNIYGHEVHHLDIDARNAHVSAYSFNSAENLRSVRIINASYIGESAFDKCMNLTDICLDVDSIGYYAFANTESIRKVYVMRENPPKAHASAFFDYNNVKLYVPKGSLEAYRNSEYCWRFFLNIEESDFSEVDDIFRADYDIEDPASVESVEREDKEADNAIDPTQPLEVYTMQGQLISRSMDGLQPGLYILRQGRKAKKVVIGQP